jgi:hypothetical protein
VYATDKPEELLQHFGQYGLKVNSEKSYISSHEAVYLQNLYSTDYLRDDLIGGIYSTYRALCRIIFPERYNKYSDDGIGGADFSSIRTISILENCKFHPLFEDFVKFISEMDKHTLHFSGDGLTNYIRRVNKTEGTRGIFDYRHGDRLKGIKSFKSFQILSKF